MKIDVETLAVLQIAKEAEAKMNLMCKVIKSDQTKDIFKCRLSSIGMTEIIILVGRAES